MWGVPAVCMRLCLHIVYANENAKKKELMVTVMLFMALERHNSLQGEHGEPLHHHYHYHHQSSFERGSWIQQCAERLAWLHLDITIDMGKMEGEKGLH